MFIRYFHSFYIPTSYYKSMSKLNNTTKIQEAIEKGPQPLYKLFNTDAVSDILADVELENTHWRGVVSRKSLRVRCNDTQS